MKIADFEVNCPNQASSSTLFERSYFDQYWILSKNTKIFCWTEAGKQ